MGNTLNDLKISIRQPLLLFIPKVAFEMVAEMDFSVLETHGVLNTLMYINSNGDITPYGRHLDYVTLLDKPNQFKANVFTLLQLQGSLSPSTFKFLFDEYLDEVSQWTKATDMVKTESKHHAKNYKNYIQSYLDFQHLAMVDHLKALQQHFSPSLSAIQKDKLLLHPSLKQMQNLKKNLPSIDKQKKQQQVKPSVTDIDSFLLEHVFNVKL